MTNNNDSLQAEEPVMSPSEDAQEIINELMSIIEPLDNETTNPAPNPDMADLGMEELLRMMDTAPDSEIPEETAETTVETPFEEPSEPEIEEESPMEYLPNNPESLIVETATSRFSSAIWFENVKSKEIVLAGLGGIGSYVAFLLGRLQPYKLYLYDPDTVENANLSGQLYSAQHINNSKVNGISSQLCYYANFYNVSSSASYYKPSSVSRPVMICGFDNMEARKIFFQNWLNNQVSREYPEKCLFIDGRLAAEEFQVLCIRGDDQYNIKRYQEEFLFSDEEAEPTICSYKQTTFMANMIASVMVNLFVNFVTNECDPIIQRDLPFFTSYRADNMYFKTVN